MCVCVCVCVCIYICIFTYIRLLFTNQPSFHSPRPPAFPTLVQYYCTTIGQYTNPPSDLPFVSHTPYNIGNNNIVQRPSHQLLRIQPSSLFVYRYEINHRPHPPLACTRYSFYFEASVHSSKLLFANTLFVWAPHPPPSSPTLVRNIFCCHPTPMYCNV